jgi:prepilin-type N-terminal cleavage/methylation domain-containing protein
MRINFNYKGFTLIELLVVIAITGALLTISVPFYRSVTQNLNLNSVTRDMASDLRYAQQLAVTTQINHRININPNTDSYQIINTQDESIIKTVFIKDSIDIQNISGLTDYTVTFNATGAADSTGTIILGNINERQAVIEIKPSGYVKIQ